MARITSEVAVAKIGNRFDLILVASARARELKKGHAPLTNRKGGAIITALREIEEGKVGREMLAVYKKEKDKRRGMEKR